MFNAIQSRKPNSDPRRYNFKFGLFMHLLFIILFALSFFSFLPVMLRLPKLQIRSLVKTRPLRLNATRLLATSKKFTPAATCITINQQKATYFPTLWKTTAILAAVGLTYGLNNSNVLALENNERKF